MVFKKDAVNLNQMSRRHRSKHRHNVLVKEPYVESYAALVLLKRYYYSIVKPEWLVWLEFRTNHLTIIQNTCELRCHYCNKGPLIIDANNKNPLVATLDHVIPIAKGGEVYNTTNLVVSCYPCNQKKADK